MMNRGVMQRQMFSNGGVADTVEKAKKRLVVMKIEASTGQLSSAERESLLRQPLSFLENALNEIYEKSDSLYKTYSESDLLKGNANASLEEMTDRYNEMLAQDREFDIAPSAQQAIPSDMLRREGPGSLRIPVEEQRRMEGLLPQMGQRDPNITEQMGINAPMNRMEMLKNQQQVSAGRATPAPSRDMLRDFQGDRS